MARTDMIDWPQSTPVCFFVEENLEGAKEGHWLHPRNKHEDTRGRVHTRCLQAHQSIRTQLGSFRVETVDAVARRIRLKAQIPRKDLRQWDEMEPNREAGWHYVQVSPVGAHGDYKVELTTRPNEDLDAHTFTYVVLGPCEDGRQRIALRDYRGKYLRYHGDRDVLVPGASSANSQGAALVVDEPLLRRKVFIIEYEDSTERHLAMPPAVDYHATIENPTSERLIKEFTFTHTKETIGTWSNEAGISLTVGASMEVTASAGVASASASMHWELTADYRRSWGGSSGETQSIEDATTITAPAYSKIDARVVTRRQRQELPFGYIIGRWGLDGEQLPRIDDVDRIFQGFVQDHHSICDGTADPKKLVELVNRMKEAQEDESAPNLIYGGVYRKVETLDSEVILAVDSKLEDAPHRPKRKAADTSPKKNSPR